MFGVRTRDAQSFENFFPNFSSFRVKIYIDLYFFSFMEKDPSTQGFSSLLRFLFRPEGRRDPTFSFVHLRAREYRRKSKSRGPVFPNSAPVKIQNRLFFSPCKYYGLTQVARTVKQVRFDRFQKIFDKLYLHSFRCDFVYREEMIVW